LEYAVKKIAELGYDGVELNAETFTLHSSTVLPHITPMTPRNEKERAVETITHHGLIVSSICAHISMIHPDPQKRRDSMEFMKGCIDMAEEFKTGIVHAISGALQEGVERRTARVWLIDGLIELIDYSEARGIRLALESVENQLVANTEDMLEVIESVGMKHLYVNFDPSHLILYGENPAESMRKYGSRVVHIHAKDARGTPDRFEFPPLGMGEINFKEIIKAAKEMGYDGFISLEYEGDIFGYSRDPVSMAKSGKEYLDQLLREDSGAGRHVPDVTSRD
jgi:sugar phosphate isomerase/epimerase